MTELLNPKRKSFYGKFSKLAKKKKKKKFNIQLYNSTALCFIETLTVSSLYTNGHYSFIYNYAHYKIQKTNDLCCSAVELGLDSQAWRGEEDLILP